MTASHIKQKLLERLDQLSEREQWKVLEYAENLSSTPRGTPSKDLLKFFGTIEPEDCRRMEEAIEEGCERVDSHFLDATAASILLLGGLPS
ncbi:MAG TPA: hypothetical protein VLX28_08085 [Thermoanaerobaculia bacterium]|nr:hypothetical protein [Thermoanaerobaculia bacterium]